MDLEFHGGEKPGQLVVVPAGDLDLYASVAFCNAVLQRIDAGSKFVVLDCSKLRYMDSSGVGSVIRILQKVKAAAGEFRASGLGGMPKKVLEMSNIISLFKVFPDAEAALKDWGS